MLPYEENDTLVSRLGSLDPKSGYKFQITLLNEGASVVAVRLSGYYATAADKHLADKLGSEELYEKQIARSEEYLGHLIAQSPVGVSMPNDQPPAAAAKAMAEDLRKIETQLGELAKECKELEASGKQTPPAFAPGDTVQLPLATRRITLEGTTWRLYDARWVVVAQKADKDSQSISYAWSLRKGAKEVFRLTKTYTVKINDYSIYLSLSAESFDGPMTLGVDQAGPNSMGREDNRTDDRRIPVGRWQQDKVAVILHPLADGKIGPLGVKDIATGVSDDTRAREIEKTLLSGSPAEKEKLRTYFPDGLPVPSWTLAATSSTWPRVRSGRARASRGRNSTRRWGGRTRQVRWCGSASAISSSPTCCT